ncbi:MAG: glycosyltransferase [Bacteroidales bacterium]|nr:glycosyltransferase [Bacteroidales bacterium]
MKYAFLANASVGHTNFMISLAQKFIEKGENVVFYLPGVKNKLIRKLLDSPSLFIDEKLNKLKIPCKILKVSISQFLLSSKIKTKRGLKEVIFALKVFAKGGKHYTAVLEKEFNQNMPDCIIYDYTFFSAISISEKYKIPRIAVYHSGLPFVEYPIPPVGIKAKYNSLSLNEYNTIYKGFKQIDVSIKADYQKIANQKINTDFLLSPNSNFLNIISTIKEAEYPRTKLPDNVFFVGSGVSKKIKDRSNFIEKKGKKLIYISFGTVFNNRSDLFIKIIKSIEITDAIILVSAGGSYNKLSKCSFNDNVHIEKFVPQQKVLQNTDLFITHGGKNSINEALNIGVPMILFPFGGEQEYNANLIEYLGVGIRITEKEINKTTDRLGSLIEHILTNNDIQSKSRYLSELHENKEGSLTAYKIINDKLSREHEASLI